MLDIVEVIKKDRNVKNCKMTFHSGKLVLHLSLDDFTGRSADDAINSIMNTIKTGVQEKYWPNIVNVVEELPRTSVGKVDYKVLDRIGDELCKNCAANNKLQINRENI